VKTSNLTHYEITALWDIVLFAVFEDNKEHSISETDLLSFSNGEGRHGFRWGVFREEANCSFSKNVITKTVYLSEVGIYQLEIREKYTAITVMKTSQTSNTHRRKVENFSSNLSSREVHEN
jgi:hypothetical protein